MDIFSDLFSIEEIISWNVDLKYLPIRANGYEWFVYQNLSPILSSLCEWKVLGFAFSNKPRCRWLCGCMFSALLYSLSSVYIEYFVQLFTNQIRLKDRPSSLTLQRYINVLFLMKWNTCNCYTQLRYV